MNSYYPRIKPFWGQEIAAATQSASWVRPGLVMATFQVLGLLLLTCVDVFAHAVTQGDKGYIQEISGVHLLPFTYLGAKHMMTGYDHILFLLGVIFFLYKLRHIAVYVSLFAIGHSTTMVLGVYYNIGINSYLIDAVIGFSVVYKALDNLGAFQRWFGVQPNTKAATLVFGRSVSYEKGRRVANDEGELIAAFTGNHGWYWRNRSEANVTVLLRTGGTYSDIKRVK